MDDLHPSRAYKVLPMPQAPMLQCETASIQPEKIDLRSGRNLLLKVFKKGGSRLPLQKNLIHFLLDTPIGRDFNLITTAGVEFKVHPVMLIGGSKALQEDLFPAGVTIPNQPTFVNLPPHFHPILVDRLFKFIYTSDYQFVDDGDRQLKQKNFKFYHATVTPDANPPIPATTASIDARDYAFHLHMYALGEELGYDALKSAAHTKLVQVLVNAHTETPSAIKDVISTTFVPLGGPSRICKDENGFLQQLVVAAVLAHEFKEWNEADQKVFTDHVQGSEYAEFRNAYNTIKGTNQDLIELGDVARSLEFERKLGLERRRAAKKSGAGNLAQSKDSPSGALAVRTRPPKGQFKSRHVAKRGVGPVAKGGWRGGYGHGS